MESSYYKEPRSSLATAICTFTRGRQQTKQMQFGLYLRPPWNFVQSRYINT